MRVLHIVTAYPRYEGDAIVPWLVQLIDRLRMRGVDVEVFTSAYRGGGNTVLAGVRVHRFRYFPARWERLTHEENAADRTGRSPIYAVAAVAYIVAGSLAIWRLARRGKFDLVHVHWPVPHAAFGWVANRAQGHPTVVTTYYGAELRVAARSRLLGALLRFGARLSRVNVAISRHTAADLARFTDRPIEIIPYSSAVKLEGSERSTLPRPFTILFVGRLVARKGVHVLLDAVSSEALANARVVIVGDGPERDALTERAKAAGVAARVEFRGRVSDDELRAAYAEADVFVLPAVEDERGDTEGLGVVLLEAMAFAIPVVASATGGIVDVVEPGVSGSLVPPGDAAALREELIRLERSPALRRTLGERGRDRLEHEFSWEAIASRWLDVYETAARLTG